MCEMGGGDDRERDMIVCVCVCVVFARGAR